MLKVLKKRCDECLFSDARIVSKRRAAEVLKSCARNDSHFECHKGTMVGENIVCRGFFDTSSTNLIRIAGRLGAIDYVDVPDVVAALDTKRAKVSK